MKPGFGGVDGGDDHRVERLVARQLLQRVAQAATALDA